MKLLYCKKCRDLIKLLREVRTCSCGAVYGWMAEDLYTAHIAGEQSVALSISFRELVRKANEQRPVGPGDQVPTFVIPKRSKSVVIEEKTT